MNLINLLSMGGYGIYVWSAYGITLLVFGINLFSSIQERKKIKKIIREYAQNPRVNRKRMS